MLVIDDNEDYIVYMIDSSLDKEKREIYSNINSKKG